MLHASSLIESANQAVKNKSDVTPFKTAGAVLGFTLAIPIALTVGVIVVPLLMVAGKIKELVTPDISSKAHPTEVSEEEFAELIRQMAEVYDTLLKYQKTHRHNNDIYKYHSYDKTMRWYRPGMNNKVEYYDPVAEFKKGKKIDTSDDKSGKVYKELLDKAPVPGADHIYDGANEDYYNTKTINEIEDDEYADLKKLGFTSAFSDKYPLVKAVDVVYGGETYGIKIEARDRRVYSKKKSLGNW